jgi:hypothetical protein
MSNKRGGCAAVTFSVEKGGQGELIVLGGQDGVDSYLNTVEYLDVRVLGGKGGQTPWEAMAPMKRPRSDFAAALLHDYSR